MPDGAFQTDRAIFDNKIWKNVLKFRLFFFIYGNAVFSESGVDIGDIHLNRGQFLRSYRNLQTDLEYVENHAVKQYSLSQVKRYVQELVQEKRLKLEVVQLGTLFTVINYEQYQGFERFENGSIEQRKNTERTLKEQIKNNNKKDKNVKNDKNKEFKDICADEPYTHKFIPPTLEQVKEYCIERKNQVDYEKWHDFYTSKNWMIGKNKMKDWKAAVRTWEKSDQPQKKQSKMPQAGNFEQRNYDDEYFDNLDKEV